MNPIDRNAEWLEADGLGGFASGTASGIRTRRYHALLLTATTPPAGRMVLVNGFDAWVETSRGTFAISSQQYRPDIVHPDGASRIESFEHEPWPRWRYEIDDKLVVEQELFVPKGESTVFMSWRVINATDQAPIILNVRPFLSGRDFHSTHHENSALKFSAEQSEERVTFQSYDGVPSVLRTRTASTRTTRLGIEIFCTPKNSLAAWMPVKIWPRRACSSFRFPKNRRC